MFKRLFFFLKQGWKYDRLYIIWNVLYQLVNSWIPVIAALMPKYIIDELMGEKNPQRLLLYVGILAGYTFIAASLSVFFHMDGFSKRCRVAAEFNSDLHRKLADADFERLENPEFLDMQEKAKKFLYCDWHGFGYLLDCALNIIGQLFTLIGITAIIATLNLWIIILFIALAVLGTAVEGKARKNAMLLSQEVISDQRGWMYYNGLFDDFGYGEEIRLNVLGNWLLSKERHYFTRVNDNQKKQNDGFIRSGVLGALFTFIQQCAAYGYLIWQVVSDSISVGSFTMYIGAVTSFAAALRSVMNSLVEIRAYDMYYDNLDDYLSIPAKLREGKHLPVKKGPHTIEFRNVSFRYQGSEHYALKNVNILLKPGEKLSIVGENGAGKTTFVKLLTRLYDPTEGEILLDGVNIKEIDYDSYMAVFSSVFQNYKLFSFSLLENVALAQPVDVTKAEDILKRIGFGDRLKKLPKGIHTFINKNFDESGFEPSGGEGQKIVLARALYREDAQIVVLDEPTAALDPKAEFELYQHFNALVEGKTAVYISHRLSSARFCDVIAVFENGSITEYGTHEELLKKSGKYAEMFEMQACFYH